MHRRTFLELIAAQAAHSSRAIGSPTHSHSLCVATNSSPLLRIATRGRGLLPPNATSIHYQWEFPRWFPHAGRALDVPRYVRELLEAQVDAIQILLRAEPGIYHYPTKIGFERDDSGRDWPREIADEIRQQQAQDRLHMIALFTLSSDNSAAKMHPEWQQITAQGTPLWERDEYGQSRLAWMCLNTPWREYSLLIMEEAAERYPEFVFFWLDEPVYAEGGCYCRWCEEGFRSVHGHALPRSVSDGRSRWVEMKQFQVDSFLRFFDDFEARIIARRPQVSWAWNGATPFDYDARLWQKAPVNSREVGSGYLEALVWAKRLVGYGRPFERSWGRDYTWMDFRLRPAYELKTWQAISVAHGGAEMIGDGPYPDGRICEAGLIWGQEAFAWKRSLRNYLQGASNWSEIAIFDSWDSARVRFLRGLQPDGSEKRSRYFYPLYGWVKLLSAANLQFDIVTELNLSQLARYKAVILPDQNHLAEPTVRALARFVSNGGKLLCTFGTGLFNRDAELAPDPRFWQLLGLEFVQFSAYTSNYIRLEAEALRTDVPPEPLLVRGPATLCHPAGGGRLATVVFPIGEPGTNLRVWGDDNPPRAQSTSHPAISLNRYGSGEVLYIAHPVDERYLRGTYWALARLMLNAVDLLVPERLVRVIAPTEVRAIGTVQPAPRRIVIHLLNESDWTSTTYLSDTARLDDEAVAQSPYPWKHPVVPHVELEVAAPFEVRRAFQAPYQRVLPMRAEGTRVRVTIPEVDTHTVVVLEP